MVLFTRTIILKFIKHQQRTLSRHSANLAKLAEVGRLESPKIYGKYETGQLFLHRIFGYRGVILFPWTARIFDRDVQHQKVSASAATATGTATVNEKQPNQTDATANPTTTTENSNDNPKTATGKIRDSNWTTNSAPVLKTKATAATKVQTESSSTNADVTSTSASSGNDATTTTITPDANENTKAKESKGSVHTFYQVLIDSRDCPYIRAQTEAVTFLGNQDSNRSLYAIPGLDYVAHEDVLPYSSTERHPLHHELFEKFLTYTPDEEQTFGAQETLKAWQEKNYPWLELSDVHRETTENIRVTVIPFYMGCRETPASSVYWWRYCIRLENLGNLSVQLRERHWRIFSLSGTLETVRGRGVVGQEPILSRRLPAFQYSSHVSLQAPSGHMWGTFRLEREDGHTFDCKIPPFSLESKPEEPTPGTTSTTTPTITTTTTTTTNNSKNNGDEPKPQPTNNITSNANNSSTSSKLDGTE